MSRIIQTLNIIGIQRKEKLSSSKGNQVLFMTVLRPELVFKRMGRSLIRKEREKWIWFWWFASVVMNYVVEYIP